MASINRAIAFLRYELGDIGIVVCPVKSIARPLKGNAPTAKNTSLLEIFNIHNVKRKRGDGDWYPDRDEGLHCRTSNGVVEDEEADHLARCLAKSRTQKHHH